MGLHWVYALILHKRRKTYVSQRLSIRSSHFEGTVERDLLVAFHELEPYTNVVMILGRERSAGGHKEMSSILADQ